jgi:hypothetical protein
MQAMPTDTLIAQRVLVRDMPDRSRIVATLRISQYGGNAHPHFSATALTYDAHGTHSGASRARRGLECDGAGCQHAEILRAFPGAVAFVRLHLSDYPSGLPMHAAANAAYHLENGNAHHALSLLRVDDLRDLPAPADMAGFVDAERDRFAAEARAARDLLELMPDANDLRGYDTFGQPIERRPLPSWLIGADPEIVNV